MIYLINYDMEQGTREEYQAVEDKLLDMGAKRVLQSQWAINSSLTAPELWRKIEDLFDFALILKTDISDRVLIAAIDLSPTRTVARNLLAELDTL